MRQIFQWQARTSDNNGSKVSQCIRKNLFFLYSSVPYRYYKNSIEEDCKKHIDIFNRQKIRDNGFLLLLSRPNSLSKVTRCFSSGFLCSFLCPPKAHERKERSANLPTALLRPFFLSGYSSRPYFGVHGESPIDFLIRKSAVNVSAHYQSAILNDLLPCFLLAFGNDFKHSLENILRPYSVNSLFHILKIQPLIICVPLLLHWITCGG